MNDFDSFAKEQLARPDVAREYYRLAPFYRLANQLVLLRKKRGLTQQELAEKAQTTQAVVSRLENVSVRCSLETIVRLAEALDAVVEVHLTPAEELKEAEKTAETSAVIKQDNEISRKDEERGIVYFGKAAKKSSQLLYQADPLTLNVMPVKEYRRRRTLEIA